MDTVPSPRIESGCCARVVGLVVSLLIAATPVAMGMDVVNFTDDRHSRFVGGYASNPVDSATPNTGNGFIAKEFDLSGISWNADNRIQSYVFLSRKHMLVAGHFAGGATVQYFSPVNGVRTIQRESQTNVPESDIGIARLSTLIPAADQIASYPLLDLPTNNSYVGRELLMYGWTARVGYSRIDQVLPGGRTVDGTLKKYLFEHEPPNSRDSHVTLQGNDSGSPSFIIHDGQLTLAGNHYYIIANPTDGTYSGGGDSFLIFPEVVAAVNQVLGEDGFALQFVLEAAKLFSGSNGNWGTNGNWSPRNIPTTTQTVRFDGSSVGKTINLGGNRTTKGILFTGTPSQTGFTFQAGDTLNVGYVGIRNEAAATHRFEAAIALSAPQHWTAASGNITAAGGVNLGPHFLNLSGPGTIRFVSGGITGSGGLSIQSGQTLLDVAATYSSPTYLYGGRLELGANGALPAGSTIVFAGGELVLSAGLTASTLRVLDASRVVLGASGSPIEFLAVDPLWSGSGKLDFSGYNPGEHEIKLGTGFGALTPAQRAAISINGESVIHRGGGKLGIATPFEKWALAHFPEEAGNPDTEEQVWGRRATPAADGVENLLKYALGLDPNTPVVSPITPPQLDAAGRLFIDVARDPGAVGVTLRAEVSENLLDWFSGPGHTETLLDDPARLVVRDVGTSAETGRRFIRLVAAE